MPPWKNRLRCCPGPFVPPLTALFRPETAPVDVRRADGFCTVVVKRSVPAGRGRRVAGGERGRRARSGQRARQRHAPETQAPRAPCSAARERPPRGQVAARFLPLHPWSKCPGGDEDGAGASAQPCVLLGPRNAVTGPRFAANERGKWGPQPGSSEPICQSSPMGPRGGAGQSSPMGPGGGAARGPVSAPGGGSCPLALLLCRVFLLLFSKGRDLVRSWANVVCPHKCHSFLSPNSQRAVGASLVTGGERGGDRSLVSGGWVPGQVLPTPRQEPLPRLLALARTPESPLQPEPEAGP